MQARELIARLALTPHPEGGWYREVHRSGVQVMSAQGPRSALTSIYYLLERGQRSRWHIVDADEVWHFYAGAPLELFGYDPARRCFSRRVLAAPGVTDQGAADQPVGVISAGIWQAARTLGQFSLVGCSVAPGFEFAGFRLVCSVPGHAEHFAQAPAELCELL